MIPSKKVNYEKLSKMIDELSNIKTVDEALEFGEIVGIIREKYSKSKIKNKEVS